MEDVNKKIFDELTSRDDFMSLIETISAKCDIGYTINSYEFLGSKYKKPEEYNVYKNIIIRLKSGRDVEIKDSYILDENGKPSMLIGEEEKMYFDCGYAKDEYRYEYTLNSISHFTRLDTPGTTNKKITLNNFIMLLIESENKFFNTNVEFESLLNG